MRLTAEQRKAVNYSDNAFITACPGSGKTRTLIAKLLLSIDEVRDSSRKIACITYTNAGVYEIENRLRTYGGPGDDDYCDISTIHAFCLNNILRYFFWRLDEYPDGFSVLPSDSDLYRELVISVCNDYGLPAWGRDRFEQLSRSPDGSPIVSEPITREIALDFWSRLHNKGFIDFPNIIYYSYKLMANFSFIVDAISSRYAWILVDEFQDTSALQVEILKLIAAQNRTNFFLVGDPYQSIFGFAGARPGLMDDLVERINAESEFHLLDNFRSSNAIIEHAERLCPRDPAMNAEGEFASFPVEPEYIHANTAYDAIIDHFIPAIDDLGISYGQAAILAPWWIKLWQVGKRLRDYGIPIFGPGARPYKRNHLFALLAEQICAYIAHPYPYIIPQIERELFFLLNNITNTLNYKVYSFTGRTITFRLINKGKELSRQNDSGMLWLENAAKEFSMILFESEFLSMSNIPLIIESVDGMKDDMLRNKVDIDNLTIADLGLFASTNDNMHLRTIHRAKGLEYDAVAIIDMHDGVIPHFSAKSDEEINEARRLLYVAITRARRLLLYITDDENDRNGPSRFLSSGELGLIA